uniref:Global nitrogen transcriptional regulator n=1 Tax=Boldia erythrosiphon TaxID=74908 RepID=A0A1X9PV22_9RHOD|nr:global nitrogen transcriptional regulator [Boldia erythrosiphon]ARO90563.1 global nitrogen transcriptional regulator [Boldia erythrosiphon]
MYYNHFSLPVDWSVLVHDLNCMSETIVINKGDIILLNNSSLVYINLQGIVAISKRYLSNKFITLYLLTSANCIFFIDNKVNYYLEGKALTSSKLLVVTFKDFINLRTHYQNILGFELNSLMVKLNYIELFANMLYHKNIRNRLINFFLIMCKNFGLIYSSGIMIDFSISHLDIATIIGASRIMVTRILNELKKNL